MHRSRPRRSTSRPRAALVLILTCATALLCACGGESSGNAGKGARPVPVSVAQATVKAVALELRGVGTVQPLASVSVTPRVGGMIVRQSVSDGQLVRQGEPLFQIDPRPLQAKLREAQAVLTRDQTSLEQARRDQRRLEDLARQAAVSEDQYEKARTDAAGLAATVEMDKAAIEQIQLELEYTDIRAPISGQAGKVLVQRGSIIEADDQNAMLLINQLSPIAVDFSVPEQHLPAIRERMRHGRPPVLALPTGDTGEPERGELTAMDNAVDKATGTIGLRAVFENAEGRLWPGQFTRATLVLGELPGAVVVPSAAVNVGVDGPYCYVVGPENKAQQRKVVMGPVADDETVIASGVAEGETVVVQGQLRLKPGTAVSFQRPGGQDEPAPAPQPAAPAS